MSDKIADNYEHWKNEAFKLCGNEDLAGDIIQDVWIKLHAKEDLKDYYVFKTIKSVFIDHCRKKKEDSLSDAMYLASKDEAFEPDDYELGVLERYKGLDWVTQSLIQESYYLSLRQIEAKYPMINYKYAHDRISSGVKQVLKGDYEERYNNTRRK